MNILARGNTHHAALTAERTLTTAWKTNTQRAITLGKVKRVICTSIMQNNASYLQVSSAKFDEHQKTVEKYKVLQTFYPNSDIYIHFWTLYIVKFKADSVPEINKCPAMCIKILVQTRQWQWLTLVNPWQIFKSKVPVDVHMDLHAPLPRDSMNTAKHGLSCHNMKVENVNPGDRWVLVEQLYSASYIICTSTQNFEDKILPP